MRLRLATVAVWAVISLLGASTTFAAEAGTSPVVTTVVPASDTSFRRRRLLI